MPKQERETDSEGDLVGNERPFWVASIFTAIWLVIVAAVVIIAVPSKDCGTSPFLCQGAGNFGSYLAGASAPVAFLWLVVAVWIQSLELKEQRRELRLTRAEFEQNRTVMEAQVQEAKNQAALLGQQTEMLKNSAAEATADRKFEAHLALVATRLRQYHNAWSFYPPKPGTIEPDELQGHSFFIPKAPSSTDTDQAVVAWAAQTVRNQRNRLAERLGASEIIARFPYDFMRMFAAVRDCFDATLYLPETSQIKARASEIDDLYRNMGILMEKAANLPVREDG
jgi:hypothetical protein